MLRTSPPFSGLCSFTTPSPTPKIEEEAGEGTIEGDLHNAAAIEAASSSTPQVCI